MSVEEFFELLISELKENKNLRTYYKFLNNPGQSRFNFRKNYFIQRLSYITATIEKPNSVIWDCGCGYGTTAIFLALNGHTIYGNTLEFYYEQIQNRLTYWQQFGNLNKLKIDYADLFEIKPSPHYGYIIAQDTLHHLEPIDKALDILSGSLCADGKLIAIEENGKNIFMRLKHYIVRGNKRIIEVYDEKLKKNYLMGNENVRSLEKWSQLFKNNKFLLVNNSVEYIRLFYPFVYCVLSSEKLLKLEKHIWKKNCLLKNYFYFGMNYTATKINNETRS